MLENREQERERLETVETELMDLEERYPRAVEEQRLRQEWEDMKLGREELLARVTDAEKNIRSRQASNEATDSDIKAGEQALAAAQVALNEQYAPIRAFLAEQAEIQQMLNNKSEEIRRMQTQLADATDVSGVTDLRRKLQSLEDERKADKIRLDQLEARTKGRYARVGEVFDTVEEKKEVGESEEEYLKRTQGVVLPGQKNKGVWGRLGGWFGKK